MIFITFPRSGVNFITQAIKLQTGIEITFQHNFITYYVGEKPIGRNIDESEDIIINIVRNPSESIVSWMAMQYEYDDGLLINNSFEKIVKSIIIPRYKKLYKKLLLLDNVIFINYNDFYNINDLLKDLYKILNLEIINNSLDINTLNVENRTEDNYLATSKNSLKYKEYKDIISKIDLSECYDLYNKALDKCIKIL